MYIRKHWPSRSCSIRPSTTERRQRSCRFRLFKYLRANPAGAWDTIISRRWTGPVMLILVVCMVAYAAALQIGVGQELLTTTTYRTPCRACRGRSSGL